MSSSAPGTTTTRQPWHHQRHRSSFTFSGQVLLATVLTVVLIVVFVIIPFLLYNFFVRGRGGGRLAVGVRRSFSSFGRMSSSRRRHHHHHHQGLDAAALASLPVTAYHRDGRANGTADCAVCLSELADGEKVRGLPGCGHVFHVECVDAWLRSRTTCPVCRAEVPQPSEDVEEAPVRVGTGGTTLVINVQGGVALARTSELGPGQPAGRAGYRS